MAKASIGIAQPSAGGRSTVAPVALRVSIKRSRSPDTVVIERDLGDGDATCSA